jgi:hypothetical protein
LKKNKNKEQKVGLGVGDCGLGIGDWAQSPIPNPQSPIPNPHNIFTNKNTYKIIYILNNYNYQFLINYKKN